MSDTQKPNAIKAGWRRFKDLLKLTWIGWFYICARRTFGGTVLLFLLLIFLGMSMVGFFGYMSVRPYTSWDELPCQTGTLVKVAALTRGQSSGTLVDDAGVEHKFYGKAFSMSELAELKPLYGQPIKVCFTRRWHLTPPFYMHDAILIFYPDGTKGLFGKATPALDRAFHLKFMNVPLLWFALPTLLWLLKRHAREAWRARRSHLDSFSLSPSHPKTLNH